MAIFCGSPTAALHITQQVTQVLKGDNVKVGFVKLLQVPAIYCGSYGYSVDKIAKLEELTMYFYLFSEQML